MKLKLITFASNNDGTKIYARLTTNNKINLIKGYYDFNKEKFIITKYFNDNIKQTQLTKNKAKKYLINILLTDYNWNL